MRIESRTPRRRPLSLTSLIDVIFLLLLFFMLSSTFSKYGEVELGQPAGTGASAPQETPKIVVFVSHEGLQINGQKATLDTAPEVLSALSEKGGDTAVVVAREDATAEDLVMAVQKIRSMGQFKITVAK